VLGDQQKVAIGVTKGAVVHVGIDHEDVQGDAFAQVGIAAAAERVQAINEIDLLVRRWQRERCPFGLLYQTFDLGVDGQEAVFDVGFGLPVGSIALCV
jgi:hypothetical protein